MYDCHREHPQFIRLLHWEGLHRAAGPIAAWEQRGAHHASKLAALAAAPKAGALNADFAPSELLRAVIALAGW
ncbi:hypothetical protein ACIBIZ_38200 [Nonomuraea spiralis]|uniref:hypothetical protein n=1 Tax=Nonomuraea spiralis TaxID=46182 RepID=UPI0010017845|nr:hypothetical protein DMB42_01440 [Nonomuraea sp. WAC 01424]